MRLPLTCLSVADRFLSGKASLLQYNMANAPWAGGPAGLAFLSERPGRPHEQELIPNWHVITRARKSDGKGAPIILYSTYFGPCLLVGAIVRPVPVLLSMSCYTYIYICTYAPRRDGSLSAARSSSRLRVAHSPAPSSLLSLPENTKRRFLSITCSSPQACSPNPVA